MNLLQLCKSRILPSEKIIIMALNHFADYRGFVRQGREELINFSGLTSTNFNVGIRQLKRYQIITRANTKPVMYRIIDDEWMVGELDETAIAILQRPRLQISTKLVAVYAHTRSKDYSANYEKLSEQLNISANTLTNAYRSLEWHGIIKRKRNAGYGQRNTVIRRPMNEWRKLHWLKGGK